MKSNNFICVVFLLMILFAVTSVGGCGGSNGSLESSTDENPGGNQNETVEYSVLDEDVLDSDGDGVPDILDFKEVEEFFYEKDEKISDKKISVPSIHYFDKLKPYTESADSFIVDLTAGTEYTVEFSKSFAYPLGNTVPDIEIINPQGNALNFLDLGDYDEDYDEDDMIIDLNPDVIEISVYPPENPSIICYTFTPASTGSYKINLQEIPLLSDDESNDDGMKTLFIYEELRNDDGEAGYYKQYRFQDEDGNVSSTISIADIIELRKAYLNSWVNLFIELLLNVDENGEMNDDEFEQIAYDKFEAYFELLSNIRNYYGLFDVEAENDDDTEAENEEETDTETSSVFSASSTASAAKSKGKINAKGTSIPSTLYGIPYSDEFEEGLGFFAVTGIKSKNDAIENFKLPIPKTKKVKARYTANFVSSQKDREKVEKTNANASVAIGGFGVNASYSSNSSFKFGLTSTTLVIHYEELETSYRSLANSKYKLSSSAKKTLKKGSKAFRNEYGDYFVAGYKYGGTYDAFISITTETTEQLQEVIKKLGVHYSSVGKSLSADIANETKDVLKKNNASVTIEIRTAGIDTNGKASKLIKKKNIDAIGDVTSQLEAFRANLKKSSPKDYLPVYVMLKRYRVLSSVLTQMNKDKDTGLIPISSKQSSRIMCFNRDLLLMQSYYNVIAGLDSTKIDSSIQDSFARKCGNITSTVQAYGNNFYMESNLKNMQAIQKKIRNLTTQLKALGDRYAFYHILMGFQAQESTASDTNDINYKPFGYNGGEIGCNTFGISKAVTSDIAAGKKEEGKHHEGYKFLGHREWSPSFTAKTAKGDTNAVYCHIQVVASNEYDLNRDVTNSPVIGKNTARFYFQSGGTRDADWDIYLQTMRFNSSLYPFYGLK